MRASIWADSVNVDKGRKLAEVFIESTWTFCRLIRPISARYPSGLSLRVSARILVSRLASWSRRCFGAPRRAQMRSCRSSWGQAEPPSMANDRVVPANRTLPRQEVQWDHPRVDVVFHFWQCDKENHGWREGRR